MNATFEGKFRTSIKRTRSGPEESCDEEDAAADDESSDVAPRLVVNTEPAVDAVPHSLPIADFEEGVDEAVYPV